jgi:hypothetical protein
LFNCDFVPNDERNAAESCGRSAEHTYDSEPRNPIYEENRNIKADKGIGQKGGSGHMKLNEEKKGPTSS